MTREQRKTEIQAVKAQWLKFGFKGNVLEFLSGINDDLLTKEEIAALLPKITEQDIQTISQRVLSQIKPQALTEKELNDIADRVAARMPSMKLPSRLFDQKEDKDKNIIVTLEKGFEATLNSLEALKTML